MSDNTKKIIVIDKKSNVNQKFINIDNINIDNLNDHVFEEKFKLNKGKGDLLKCAGWKLDEFIIILLGWKNGNAGNENKTEIPPPEDNSLYFGDIIFIKTKDNLIQDFTINEYDHFYDIAFDGFESLGSSDSESDGFEDENEYDSDDSFIDNSEQDIDIKNQDDEYNVEVNNLDEDSKTSSSSSSESLLSLDTELNNLK